VPGVRGSRFVVRRLGFGDFHLLLMDVVEVLSVRRVFERYDEVLELFALHDPNAITVLKL
jgi:hypothetical protein